MELIKLLEKQYSIEKVETIKDGETFITVPSLQALDVVATLKNYHGYRHLILLTAVDWVEENKFQLTYLINNRENKSIIGVRTFIERSTWPEESTMQSGHHLWPAMKTYQRELHEMFGIDFPDSPEINEPLILEYWDQIPPYRKDFDTEKYTEETYFPREGRFTIDPAENMKEKLYKHEGEKC